MNCDPELPAYYSVPTHVCVASHKVPQIQFSHLPQRLYAGEFLEGKVKIEPRQIALSRYLIITLSGIEQVREKRACYTDTLTRHLEFDCGKTVIPLSAPLKPGLSYEFSFSFQPSMIHDKCRCKSSEVHKMAPPSIGGRGSALDTPDGVSVRYFVYARLHESSISTCKLIEYLPTGPNFELSCYRDDVSSLERVHMVGSSLKTGLLKQKYNSTLALHACPAMNVYYWDDEMPSFTGYFSFTVIHYPEPNSAPGLPLSASYSIYYTVGTAASGISDHLRSKNHKLSRMKVCGADINLEKCSWSGNKLDVATNYTIPIANLRTPSYVSCLSFAVYDIVIIVKHCRGTLKLDVPLVVQSAVRPGYSS